MYCTKTDGGRCYTVEYPEFEGDGCTVINDFYRHLALCAAEYFGALTQEIGHSICRCRFSAEESDDSIAVTVVLTLRQSGRRICEKTLSHRWRMCCGRDWLLER